MEYRPEVNWNQNYGYDYMNQNTGYQNYFYPSQATNNGVGYDNQYTNYGNYQYSIDINQEQLPPIYAKSIETVKETTENQVKYFEPIHLSDTQDLNEFLQNGLMKQITPKIIALKQETQQSSNSDPNVHTEVIFDLKQNDAIYQNKNNLY